MSSAAAGDGGDKPYVIGHSLTDPAYEPNSYVNPDKHQCRLESEQVVVMHKDTNRGIEVLHNPVYNKGTSYSLAERERLGVRGLVPPRFFSLEDQHKKVWALLNENEVPIRKWRQLQALQDRNETLFYYLLVNHIEELAPIIYTPTVGEAAIAYSRLFRRARGMYFSADDRGHFNAMMYNWKQDDVSCIVVTDGSRILGLGDLGAQGMAISVGKLDLYVAGAGIDPGRVLPCVLDLGTNNEELLADDYYFGIQRRRLEGDEYYDTVNEFMRAVKNRWPRALVQFEDFQTKHAMPILNRYRETNLCFNDDIQGTAAVVLSGVYGALRVLGKQPAAITDQTFVLCGAGSAGMGIATFLHTAMVYHGLSAEEAYKRFYILDADGLITSQRQLGSDPGSEAVSPFARQRTDLPDGISLEEVVKQGKPTVLMGASTVQGLFSKEVLEEMGRLNERPVIMPLSNPTSRAECTAEDAAIATQGRALFSSGSPFDDVEVGGRVMRANQGNNFYVFPGLGLGALLSGAPRITDSMLNAASEAIPDMLDSESLARGCIYPRIHQIREISAYVAERVIRQAAEEGLARKRTLELLRQGDDALKNYIRSSMYYPEYRPTVFKP